MSPIVDIKHKFWPPLFFFFLPPNASLHVTSLLSHCSSSLTHPYSSSINYTPLLSHSFLYPPAFHTSHTLLFSHIPHFSHTSLRSLIPGSPILFLYRIYSSLPTDFLFITLLFFSHPHLFSPSYPYYFSFRQSLLALSFSVISIFHHHILTELIVSV